MEVLIVPDADEPPGTEVVHKTASRPADRERLLREAGVLRAAAERGIAGVAAIVRPPSTEDEMPTMVTRAVAGPSLAVVSPLSLVEVAGVAALVAGLLASLHEAGLAHGAVEPGHVVLDGEGGAILVGLGDGGETGALSPLDPATDVAGWGSLVTHLLDWSAGSDDEPLVALRRNIGARPGRRRRPSLPAPRTVEHDRRVLAALADQAQDPDPVHRPSARSLEAAVRHRIPAARMPGAPTTSIAPAPPPGLLDRLSGHLATSTPASSAGQATQPAAADDIDKGDTSDPSPPAEPATTRLLASLGRRPVWTSRRGRIVLCSACLAGLAAVGVSFFSDSATEQHQAAAPGSACPPATPPAADADGDGCEETVRWTDGVLRAGPARFAIGVAGDSWVVGDWDCDGRRTPALLHDGVLTVFDTWPGPDSELPGRIVTGATGAAGLSVAAGFGRCERPVLARPGAADLIVDPRASP